MMSTSQTKSVFLAFALLITASVVAKEEPVVTRVEPPNWWIGINWSPVQLMVTGRHLENARFSTQSNSLEIGKVQISNNGHYAFVDVSISADAEPGEYTIVVETDQGTTQLTFPIRKRHTQTNRHQGFGTDDVIYLITPDRFANGNPGNDRCEGLDDFDPSSNRKRHGGDLQGITERLDYLKELGVTTIWLNPILENSGTSSYHGYATTDYYRVDPRFGTNEEYRRFVDESHKRGLKVIFDHVSNHIGINHPWIKELPAEDWLNGSVQNHKRQKHYLLSVSDPHAPKNSSHLLKTFWFVDGMPDLNQKNENLAKYLIQNTMWWIEYSGIDGIREDTYPYNDQVFMARWAKAILDEYPRFNIVGEIWANHPAYIALFQSKSKLPRDFETNLPAVMDFPLMEVWRRFLTGEAKLRDVYEVYSQDFVYSDLENLVVFLDNHDISRAIFHAKSNNDRFKLALTVLLFARGIPQILYGTEIGMMGGSSHVELRADFPGGFPDDEKNAFSSAGRTPRQTEFFDFVQKLLHLRKTYPALSRGQMIHFPPSWSRDVYLILKVHGDQKILIVANSGRSMTVPDFSEVRDYLGTAKKMKNLLNGQEIRLNRQFPLKSPAMSAEVFLIEE